MKCKRFTALLMAAAVSIGAFSINAYAPAAYFESLGANAPVITAQVQLHWQRRSEKHMKVVICRIIS